MNRSFPAAVATLVAALAVAPAAAQVTGRAGDPPAGITVVGHGTVALAPDRLRVLVRLFPRNVTGDQLDAAAKGVAQAMRSAGIADAAEVLPVLGSLGPSSTVAVTGTLAKPTRDSLEGTLRATLRAIPDAAASTIGTNYSVQTALAVDDCSAADARLQAAAIADARARAERAASAAGVHLGDIVAVSEITNFVSPECGGGGAGNFNTIGGGDAAYGPVSVDLTLNAVVTFAIR